MNTILEGSKQMPYYTNLKLVFDALEGRQKEFNWLITNMECNYAPNERFYQDKIFISGEELTKIVYENDIQFIWAVLSAFTKSEYIDIDNLEVEPYADGNPGFWVFEPQIQHPKAIAEIVCWDSTLTMLLSKDDDLTFKFRKYFTDSKDLNEDNKKYKN